MTDTGPAPTHPVREPDDYLVSLALLVRQCLIAHGIPVTPEVGQ